MHPDAQTGRIEAAAYVIPTDAPEADGTYAWNSTTLVVVYADAQGQSGIGYTYADASVAGLVRGVLARAVQGRNSFNIP